MFVWAEDMEGRWLYGLWESSNAWRIHQKGRVEVYLVRPSVLQYVAELTEDDTRVGPLAFANHLRFLGGVQNVTSSTPHRHLKMVERYDTYLSFSVRGDGAGRHESHPISPLDEFYVSSDGRTLKIDQRKWFRCPDAIREYRAFEPQFVTKEEVTFASINTEGLRALDIHVKGEDGASQHKMTYTVGPVTPSPEGIRPPRELRVGEEVLDLNHGRVNPTALRELDILIHGNSSIGPAHSVTVNGRPASACSPIAYDEVLLLADMRPGASVTYSKGPESNREGTLYKGKLVDVQEGMTFCVAYTDNA
jgi:hypothetical protein